MIPIGITEEEAVKLLESTGTSYRLERTAPPRGAGEGAVWRVVRVREHPLCLTLCAFAPSAVGVHPARGVGA